MDYEEDFDQEEYEVSVATASDIPINLPASMVELIVDRATRTLVDKLKPVASKKLEALIDGEWNQTIRDAASKQATELVNEWVAKPRQETNRYGEPSGEVFTFADRMMKVWEEHLKEQVDSSGRKTEYRGESRLQYMVKSYAMPELEKISKEACEKVRNEAKARVQEALAAFLAQQLAPRVELKTIS